MNAIPIMHAGALLMPLPAIEIDAALSRWANGDAEAAAFLRLICSAARLADDIADGASSERDIVTLLHLCLVQIPANGFYRAHFDKLSTPLNEAVLAWEISDEWKSSGDRKKQEFGFVYREATDRIGLAVAYITGGLEHARFALRDIYEVCHSPFVESVEDWVGGN